MRKKTAILMCLLVVSLLVASAVVVAKKPPPKPPPDPPPAGTVFFQYNEGDVKSMWTMNAADGSEKTKLDIEYGLDGSYVEFEILSRLTHDDHYWFLRFETLEGEYYPDDTPRREIFAVRDDNVINEQLTFDNTLVTNRANGWPVWGIDDDIISWSAKRWPAGEPGPTEFGIYGDTITFLNGVPELSGSPFPIWDTGYFINYYEEQLPDILGGFDWSPDETKIVYRDSTTGSIYIADLVGEEKNLLTSGWYPQWSPNGEKIAFNGYTIGYRGHTLCTINPDGTDEKIIVKGGKKGNEDILDARWSPDSNHLVYRVRVWKRIDIPVIWSYIYRIGADGNDKTCLTRDIRADPYKDVVAWR